MLSRTSTYSTRAIAAFGAFLIVVFNSAYGVINARKQRVMAAKVMGATRWQIFKDVPVLYGFASKAPLGRYAGPLLERVLQHEPAHAAVRERQQVALGERRARGRPLR